MGAFDKLFGMLGFENQDSKNDRIIEKQKKDESSFNLHEKRTDRLQSLLATNFNTDPTNKLLILKPTNLKDMQDVVDHFKDTNCIQLNTEDINGPEKDRLLDFLSGALYALEMNIVKTDEDCFIITKSNFPIFKKKKDN